MVETCGSLGSSAVQLVKALAEASEELLELWSREEVICQLVGSVAMVVQPGGAMAFLYGYDRCLHAMRVRDQE